MIGLTRRGALLGGAAATLGGGAALLGLRPGREDLGPEIRSLTWTDLRPEGAEDSDESQAAGPTSEADWLQTELSRLSNGEAPAPTGWTAPPQPSGPWAEPRADLDGLRVALAGYMTPLDFDALETRLFLLVPYVGACIHVPAPPANQIVLVSSEAPVPVLDLWQPFTAIGRIRVERQDTELAEVAYRMDLERLAALTPPGAGDGPVTTW